MTWRADFKTMHTTIELRQYRDDLDLEAMRNLLIAGRAADNGSYYVHIGDLDWWLSYPPDNRYRRENIYLWSDQAGLLAWILFSPQWCTIDVFVRPDERGSSRARHIYAWAVEMAQARILEQGDNVLRTMWISARDEIVVGWLESFGFKPSGEYMLYLKCSLEEVVPPPCIPEGFQVRSVAGEGDAVPRARASYAAFYSDLPFDVYLDRYLKFMRSPVYLPERDLVCIAPNGQFSSFGVLWLDSVNQVGLFEPVGTHPDFQRMGLAKALILEGMRSMQKDGMASAVVCAGSDNLVAIWLYESVGFQLSDKLCTYGKSFILPTVSSGDGLN
jgi:mycothiol synthase